MSFELISKENNQAKINMTVSPEEFEKATQTAYLKNRGKFNIPGFRKGKVPRKIIESQYGKGVFFEDAINSILPEIYPKALDELSIEPVDRPDIDIKEMEDGKDIIIEAVVTVKPEVSISDYKGVEVEKVLAEVTDELVEEELEKSRDMNGRLVVVEDRGVEENDTVTIDFEGTIDGVPFEGGKGEGYPLVIGSGQFIPGYEEQLIGAKHGEEVEVKVTFPEDYKTEDLAGKEAVFMTKINEIKTKELPELDDEFAKDTSEFDTLEELKKDIKEKLEETAKKNAESANRDKVIDAVVEKMVADIPEVMFETEVDGMIREFDQQLKYQGMGLDLYLQYTGQDMSSMKEQMRGEAEARVKTSLAIEAIKDLENVEATEEEIEKEIEKIAEAQKQSVEEIKKIFNGESLEYIKSTIESRKVVDMLVENANFK
jgi:trigger factor